MKKLVRGVVLNNLSDSVSDISDRYQILKVKLDDNLMQEITAEGEKYKFSHERILKEIRQADDRIKFAPGIYSDYNTLKVSELPAGKHIVFHFRNEDIGTITISTITLNSRAFMILDPAIGGLCYRDIIEPVSPEMQIGVRQLFKVYRGRTLATPDYVDYCPGQLLKIDYYQPSTIFELMDIDHDFVKIEEKPKSRDDEPQTTEATTKSTDSQSLDSTNVKHALQNTYFVWFPHATTPPSWNLKNIDNNPKAPFKIEFEEGQRVGRISVNHAFKFSEDSRIREYEEDNIKKCSQGYSSAMFDKRVMSMKPGTVSCKPKSKTWVILEEPIIFEMHND